MKNSGRIRMIPKYSEVVQTIPRNSEDPKFLSRKPKRFRAIFSTSRTRSRLYSVYSLLHSIKSEYSFFELNN